MQRSLYGHFELAYNGPTLKVGTTLTQRVKMFAMFGFWFYFGMSGVIGGITRHHTAWIAIGAVLVLFNGFMLVMQCAGASSMVRFDRSTQTFRRGSRTKPFTDAPRIDLRLQSGTYLISLIVRGGSNIPLNMMWPFKQEAEARRVAMEISEFTGIPLKVVSTTPDPTPTAPPPAA